MKPPVAPVAGNSAQAADKPPAASALPTVLRKRSDFLAASRAARVPFPGFVLQARKRAEADELGIRVGFTCSKKVGNAVARNRAKRRLRAIAAEVLPQSGKPGWDYVLVGRFETTANRPYLEMIDDLQSALTKVHKARQ